MILRHSISITVKTSTLDSIWLIFLWIGFERLNIFINSTVHRALLCLLTIYSRAAAVERARQCKAQRIESALRLQRPGKENRRQETAPRLDQRFPCFLQKAQSRPWASRAKWKWRKPKLKHWKHHWHVYTSCSEENWGAPAESRSETNRKCDSIFPNSCKPSSIQAAAN